MSYSLVNKLMDPKGEPRKRMKAAGLSIYARSVLLELAQFANERNYRAVNYCECWPSHATLASGVHCSVSGVKNALKQLEEAGFIYWIQSLKHATNVYLIEIAALGAECNNPIPLFDDPEDEQEGKSSKGSPSDSDADAVVDLLAGLLGRRLSPAQRTKWIEKAQKMTGRHSVADLRPALTWALEESSHWGGIIRGAGMPPAMAAFHIDKIVENYRNKR
jgi:hypothetical protein